jgi:hypothetical protein
MTHDELLDRIAQEGLKPDGNVLNTRLILAFRAVVELAGKDIKHESYVWLDGYDYAMKQIIQAIEKELGCEE